MRIWGSQEKKSSVSRMGYAPDEILEVKGFTGIVGSFKYPKWGKKQTSHTMLSKYCEDTRLGRGLSTLVGSVFCPLITPYVADLWISLRMFGTQGILPTHTGPSMEPLSSCFLYLVFCYWTPVCMLLRGVLWSQYCLAHELGGFLLLQIQYSDIWDLL